MFDTISAMGSGVSTKRVVVAAAPQGVSSQGEGSEDWVHVPSDISSVDEGKVSRAAPPCSPDSGDGMPSDYPTPTGAVSRDGSSVDPYDTCGLSANTVQGDSIGMSPRLQRTPGLAGSHSPKVKLFDDLLYQNASA